MLINQQIQEYGTLNQWFQSPLGLFVAREFTYLLKSLAQPLQGETLLQLGNCGSNGWLDTLRFNHKWIASPLKTNQVNQIECSLSQLPISRNSLDCVVVPLTLEPFGNGFGLLDEIDRVLKPMGCVVFMSINPWSVWGASVKCGWVHCYAKNKIKLRTPYHLNRIFLQRGYVQQSLIHFCYIPPINDQNMITKLSFFNEMGKMLWPFPSGLYCYIAQKYEYIKPSLMSNALIKPISADYKSPLQPAVNNLHT